MEILVTYDVATDTADGRRRLRHVAQVCEGYGQRVQKSVFECRVNPAAFEQLRRKLEGVINASEDSLRFYRLQEPRERYLQVMGRAVAHDLHDPLII